MKNIFDIIILEYIFRAVNGDIKACIKLIEKCFPKIDKNHF
jgi:hypothetical protein